MAAEAVQFGIVMQSAVQPSCVEGQSCYSKGAVAGWAIGVVTVCSILNVSSRRLSLNLNSAFGLFKTIFVVGTVVAGFAYNSRGGSCRNITWQAKEPGSNFGDTVLALVFSMYSYTAFDQPFYVLREVRHPRQIFVSSLVLSMGVMLVLFPLVNVAYYCVVPYDGSPPPKNLVTALYTTISDWPGAERVVIGFVATFIAGSIVAQTYTASRVNVEIAKEGILPQSLYWASTGSSFYFRGLSRYWRGRLGDPAHLIDRELPEQVPLGGTILHWLSTVLLIVVGIVVGKASDGYTLLTFLRVFPLAVLLGAFTLSGLAHLKIAPLLWLWQHKRPPIAVPPGAKAWAWRPPLDPLPTLAGAAALTFLSVAIFARPSQLRVDDPLPYWAYPLLGWSPVLLGVLWWLCLRYWEWKSQWTLVVNKRAYAVEDGDGDIVVKAEVVSHSRQPILRQRTREFRSEREAASNGVAWEE